MEITFPVPRGARYQAVAVAALGYFVDLYDLVLFSVVRVRSLTDLGVERGALLDTGVLLLNAQMAGMLVGGVFWGILGDRRGRLSVLYGSILLYSLANFANAFVSSVTPYALLRFAAGVGLAGELGAGVTLVVELMDKQARGWGTTIIATVGVLGAVAAASLGEAFAWRTAYCIGGALGATLLLLRIRVRESGMFERLRGQSAPRGRLSMLFSPPARAARYLRVIGLGLPIWFTAAILVTFSPEFGKQLGMAEPPTAGRAVLFYYLGLAFGDFGSGLASQLVRSRKRVLRLFIGATAVAIATYFLVAPRSLVAFYTMCTVLGVANGYWAVFATTAAEQFGTNLRSTVATSVPNFVRGAVVPITLCFQAIRPSLGMISAALVIGGVVVGLAVLSLSGLDETFGRDLDYLET